MRGPYYLELMGIDEAKHIMQEIGCDQIGIEWMSRKAKIYPLLLKDVRSAAANILKQQLLSLGGEAAVGRGVVNSSQESTHVLMLATRKQYNFLQEKLMHQPWGLKRLSGEIEKLLSGLESRQELNWRWADRKLSFGRRTLVMGILNVTEDSFSDGGRYLLPEQALVRALEMEACGADIIDVGGESTRPGAEPVTAEEELKRIIPVLELLLNKVRVPISVDTYKAEVAREAIKKGVHIINDVGGGLKDERMAQVVAEFSSPVIIMHNPIHSLSVPKGRIINDLIFPVMERLEEGISCYEEAGLPAWKICVDPGIGFGKGITENINLLRHIRTFASLGKPVLIGASRKSFIGATLDSPVNERLEGSLAVAAWSIIQGAGIIRVHDVKETVRLSRMLEAIKDVGDNNAAIR